MHIPMKSREISDGQKKTDYPHCLSGLTHRQKEVAWLLSRTGLSYKQAASHLEISEGTMRKHVENVYRRMGVHSRAELMVLLVSAMESLENFPSY